MPYLSARFLAGVPIRRNEMQRMSRYVGHMVGWSQSGLTEVSTFCCFWGLTQDVLRLYQIKQAPPVKHGCLPFFLFDSMGRVVYNRPQSPLP